MDNLSKTAQTVEIPIAKIAVDQDNSYASLQRLLYSGYDRVKWNLATSESCPICQKIAELVNGNGEGLSLARFLGMSAKPKVTTDEQGNTVPVLNEYGEQEYDYTQEVDIYRDAPIYNMSHVGCLCFLTVYKSGNPSDSVLVTHNG